MKKFFPPHPPPAIQRAYRHFPRCISPAHFSLSTSVALILLSATWFAPPAHNQSFTFEKIEDADGLYDRFTFARLFPDGKTMLFRASGTTTYGYYDIATRRVTHTVTFPSGVGGPPELGEEYLLFGAPGGGLATYEAQTAERIFAVTETVVGEGTLERGGVAGDRTCYGIRDGGPEGVYVDENLVIPAGLADPGDTGLTVGAPNRIGFTPFLLAFIPDTPSILQGDRIFIANSDGTGVRRLADTETTPPGEPEFTKFGAFWRMVASGNNVVFRASFGIGPSGLFLANIDGDIQPIVTTRTELPQGGGNFGRFDTESPGFWIDGDDVLFTAETSDDIGAYLWREGTLHKVAARGDVIDGSFVVSARTKAYSIAAGVMVLELRLSNDPDADEFGTSPTLYFVNAPGSSGPTPTPTPIVSAFPDLTLSKTVIDNPLVPEDIMVGDLARFRILVSNVGDAPTTGPITVVDTLPPGLTYFNGGGEGWECSAEGQTVTCVREGPLSHEVPFTSEFILMVRVSNEAVPSVQNSASVSTPGEQNTSNNETTVVALVAASPLSIRILSPDEGSEILVGERPEIVFRAETQESDLIQSGLLIWDGGEAYSSFSFTTIPLQITGSGRISMHAGRVPSELSDGQTVTFAAQARDMLGRGSDFGLVTATVKRLPEPPVVTFIKPSQGEMLHGDEVNGFSLQSVATIKADFGLALRPLLELDGIVDPGFINFSTLPFVLQRNGSGSITLMNFFISLNLTGEDFAEVFPLGTSNVFLEVTVIDNNENSRIGSLPLQIVRDPAPKLGSTMFPVIGKGNNQIDTRSRIVDSLVSNSEISKSLIIDSTVDNCAIDSSILLPGVIASNATIDFGVVLEGAVSRYGTTLTPPAPLADLYGPGEFGHVLSTVLAGDANEDGNLTVLDWLALPPEWRQDSEAFDLNLTNEVDPDDLLTLLQFWRERLKPSP